MVLTTSQKMNEIKRSFNKLLEDGLSNVSINFDDTEFIPPDSGAFLVVRYTGSRIDPCGIGEVLTGGSDALRGRWHRVEISLGAYSHQDAQKKEAGDLFDKVSDLLKAGDIPLYDFSDPQSPSQDGKMYIETIPSAAAPIPLGLQTYDPPRKNDLSQTGYSVLGLGVILSVLEEY